MPEKFTEVELRIKKLEVTKQGFWESLVKESKFEKNDDWICNDKYKGEYSKTH